MSDVSIAAIEASAIRIQKAALWAQAKGLLQAMVDVEGQCNAHDPAHSEQRRRWREADQAIEAFIGDFEGNGLHE